MKLSDDSVEAAARAIFKTRCGGLVPDHVEEFFWEDSKAKARTAITAYLTAEIGAGRAKLVAAHEGYEDQQWFTCYGAETPEAIVLKLEPSK